MSTTNAAATTQPNRTRQIVFTAIRVLVALALILYLARSGSIEWSSLGRLLSAWWIIAVAIVLFFVDMVITAWRLCVLLRARGLHLSLWASVRLTLIGLLFSTCLPGATGGDAVRMYYAMAGNAGRRTEVATVILLDRALGMLGLLLLPLPFALLAPPLQDGILSGLVGGAATFAAVLVGGAFLFFATGIRTSRAFVWLLAKVPGGRVIETMIDTVYAYRKAPGALLAGVGISALAHLTTVLILVLFSRVITPDASAWQIGVLIPLGLVANGLPVTPGGLGVGEAAFDRLFTLAGLTGGIELMLGWRFLTLIGALAGLVVYLLGDRRYVQTATPAQPGTLPREQALIPTT